MRPHRSTVDMHLILNPQACLTANVDQAVHQLIFAAHAIQMDRILSRPTTVADAINAIRAITVRSQRLPAQISATGLWKLRKQTVVPKKLTPMSLANAITFVQISPVATLVCLEDGLT